MHPPCQESPNTNEFTLTVAPISGGNPFLIWLYMATTCSFNCLNSSSNASIFIFQIKKLVDCYLCHVTWMFFSAIFHFPSPSGGIRKEVHSIYSTINKVVDAVIRRVTEASRYIAVPWAKINLLHVFIRIAGRYIVVLWTKYLQKITYWGNITVWSL